MNDLTLIRKNLFRKKLRAFLLTFSIMVAFLIYGALGALDNVLYSGVEAADANRLVTVNRIHFTQSMPRAYYQRVQAVDGIEAVTHANWFGGYYQDETQQLSIFAVDPESYLEVYNELSMPPDQREAFLNTRTCLAVGADIAPLLGVEVGDRIPLRSNIFSNQDGTRSWEFDVCMIFDGGDNDAPVNYALFHYEYFNESITFGQDQLGWFVIRAASGTDPNNVATAVDELFLNSPAETRTDSEAAFSQAFIDQLGNIGLIITLVAGAAFATILMIVGTTMVMAINERLKEIAVLKTLGFTAPRVFRMVLAESVLLSVIGGGLGLLLTWGMISALAAALGPVLPGLSLPTDTVLTAIGIMIGLGLATGLVPAINAQRVKIVTALGKQ